MPGRRKVFRIETSAVARRDDAVAQSHAASRHAETMAALAALRAMLAAAMPQPAGNQASPPAATAAAARLSIARIACELEAVVSGSAQATDKILAAVEQIDELSHDLSAALIGRPEQGLAEDIQDLVIQIFEACNFQDLIGQRVGKVMATLDPIDAAAQTAAPKLHGPGLDFDSGHASQHDIDALFPAKN
jgi:chemotaxis protein CheZ